MLQAGVVERARSKRLNAFKAGVSTAVLLTASSGTPVWAQAEMTQVAPDSTQQAALGREQGEPAADAGGNDVVVTGRRAALEAADERKRRSETIIDSVVADEAGRLPDNSVTEVLQRVSGVTIVRFAALNDPDHYSVEGSGIQVRGLTGVATRLNGREIFGANNGRALSFTDVTPELMAAVDVYKASTADLIEGGTGGQVDLRTKVPFDFNGGFHVAGTGDLSVGDLAQKGDLSGSVLVTDTFDTGIGRIGLLADVAYSRLSSNSHFFRVEPYFRQRIGTSDYFIPGGYTYGEEQFQRTRTGLYGAVQWEPVNNLTLTGTFFQSRYKNKSGDWGAFVSITPNGAPSAGDPGSALSVNPANSQFDANGLLLSSPNLFSRNNFNFQPNGAVTSGGNKGAYDSPTRTRDYSFSFAWTPDDSPLAIRGALQRVDSRREYTRLDVFRDTQFQSGFGLDLTGDLPRVSVPAGSQAFLNDPANYFWSASMPHDEINRGRLDSAQLDLEYKFDNSFLRSVKVGGRAAERTERDLQNGYNWVALGRGWNGDPQLTYANAAPGDVEQHIFKDFFHGEAVLPANLFFPTDALVRRFNRAELTRSPPAGFCGDPNDPNNPLTFNCSAAGPLPRTGYGNGDEIRAPGFVLPGDQVDNRTRTYAGYALARFGPAEGDRGIGGNVGLRVVRIENRGSGFIQQNANSFIRNGQLVTLGQQFIARGGEAEFTRYLPSVNLDYSPTDNVKLRFGYNITLDLPTFQALRASGSIGAATSSNPVAGGPSIFNNFTADTGNPLLKPTMSNNFDVSLEWYVRPGTAFHVAPFYKRLTDLPIFSITTRDVPVVFTNGTSEIVSATATDYINSDSAAKVKGVEVGGRFFLDMLPGVLSGLGFEGNYTFIDSSNPGDLYRDIDGNVRNDAPLVGLSKHNFNATLLYERKAVSARLAYSWRSRYLLTTNSNGTNQLYGYTSVPGSDTTAATARATQIALPIYGGDYGQLEGGIRLRITDNFSYSIQGTNILNATQRTLMGGYPGGATRGRSWFQTDRRLAVGLNLTF